jgi:hypothetical protein
MIYEDEFSESLNDSTAEELAIRLLRFFQIIFRGDPPDKKAAY